MLALARRRWRRARLRRLAGTRPGASPALAIPVTTFGEIDDHLRHRRCACGGDFARRGEGFRGVGGGGISVGGGRGAGGGGGREGGLCTDHRPQPRERGGGG